VFLLAEMHQDEGLPFSIGDRATWPVRLRNGGETGCPPAELKVVEARLIADASPVARPGRVAITPELSASWSGPEPVGSTLVLPAFLEVDIWQRPPTTMIGTVTRIRVVTSASQLDARGIWVPSGTWRLTDTRTATTRFARDYADPSAPHEIGVLVDLDIALPNAGGKPL
jgi:hypothetical protein